MVLWEAITQGEARRPGQGYVFSGKVAIDSKSEGVKYLHPDAITSSLFMVQAEGTPVLFGADSTRYRMIREFRNLRLNSDSQNLFASGFDTYGLAVPVVMEGSETSEVNNASCQDRLSGTFPVIC